MVYYHGMGKSKNYFEGWYLKHQNENETLAVIPGIQMDSFGKKSAFIQVIADGEAHYIPFAFSEFAASRERFGVKIGENLFGERGIRLHLNTKELSLHGTIRYGRLSPIQYDIMGPFRFVPFLECNHGVLSMSHTLTGRLWFQGKELDFTGGKGYLEKDWGSSFPRDYLWSQCNWLDEESCSVMVSAAHIPFLGTAFQGCISVICYEGKEYRLATYLGAKIVTMESDALMLRQGDYLLRVDRKGGTSHPLKAPSVGMMSRIIRESPSCTVRYRFAKGNQLLFDLESDRAGFEFATENL